LHCRCTPNSSQLVIDTVPKLIQFHFIRQVISSIQEVLLDTIAPNGEDGEDRCKDWMAEPPDYVFRRDELLNKKAKLEVRRFFSSLVHR
jgi:hypothetical protein